MKKQVLPFTVHMLKSNADLAKVVRHRAQGYGRRSSALGNALALPEPADAREPGREIIVAKSKMDGAVMGSLRLHINHSEPTNVERAIALPEALAGARIMDASRFCCAAGHVCRGSLFKAALLYAKSQQVDYFLIATLPRIQPLYESVGFRPLFEGDALHPMPMAENLPHRIMHMNMATLERDVAQYRPAMMDFLFETEHEDIDVSDALPLDDNAPQSTGVALSLKG
jgi:hypothetical protein